MCVSCGDYLRWYLLEILQNSDIFYGYAVYQIIINSMSVNHVNNPSLQY